MQHHSYEGLDLIPKSQSVHEEDRGFVYEVTCLAFIRERDRARERETEEVESGRFRRPSCIRENQVPPTAEPEILNPYKPHA